VIERRRLGRTGLEVPVIGLGTWPKFDLPPEREPNAASFVEQAFEIGVRLFDCSPMYGRADAVVGRALGGRRDDVVVASKIWSHGRTGQIAALEGRFQFEAHLQFYGGRVDLEQIHNLEAPEDHLPWLEEERERGRLRWIGATHWQAPAFEQLADLMRSGRLDTVQVPYSPLEPEAAELILPLAEELDIGVIVMRPFGSGELFPGPPAGELDELGLDSWSSAILKWILSDRRVHAAIPATFDPRHLAANAAAGREPWLTEDERAQIAALARRGRS
jgi:aryl-alcohol dehydrogenase-like predicted oxidoreductase